MASSLTASSSTNKSKKKEKDQKEKDQKDSSDDASTASTAAESTKSDVPVTDTAAAVAASEEASTKSGIKKEKDKKKSKEKDKKEKKKKKDKRKSEMDDCSVGSGSSYYYNYDSDSSLSSTGSELITGGVAKKKNRKVIAKEASKSSLLDSASIPNNSFRRTSLLSDDDDDSFGKLEEEEEFAEFQMDLTFLKATPHSSFAGGMDSSGGHHQYQQRQLHYGSNTVTNNADTFSLDGRRNNKSSFVRRVKSNGSPLSHNNNQFDRPPSRPNPLSMRDSSAPIVTTATNTKKEKRKKTANFATTAEADGTDGSGSAKHEDGIRFDWRKQKSKSSRDVWQQDDSALLLLDDSEEEVVLFDWAATNDDDHYYTNSNHTTATPEKRRASRKSRTVSSNDNDSTEDTTKKRAANSRREHNKSPSVDTDSSGDDGAYRRPRLRRSKSSGDSAVGGLQFPTRRKSNYNNKKEKATTEEEGASTENTDSAEHVAATPPPKRKSKKSKEVALSDFLDPPDENTTTTTSSKPKKAKKSASTNSNNKDNNNEPAESDSVATPEDASWWSADSSTAPPSKPKKGKKSSAAAYNWEDEPTESDTVATPEDAGREDNGGSKKKKGKKDKTTSVSPVNITEETGSMQFLLEPTTESDTVASQEDPSWGDLSSSKKKKSKKEKAINENAEEMPALERQKSTDSTDPNSRNDSDKHDWEALAASPSDDIVVKNADENDSGEFAKTPKKKTKDKKEKRKEGIRGRRNTIDGYDPPPNVNEDEDFYNWSPRKTPTSGAYKSPRKLTSSSTKAKKTIIGIEDRKHLPEAPPLIRATSSPAPPRTSSATPPPPLTRATSSATEASGETNMSIESAPPSVPAIRSSPRKKKKSVVLKIEAGEEAEEKIERISIFEKNPEEEEEEALISYAGSLLKTFTDDPTQYSDAAMIALLEEYPQSASIKFSLESSAFRGGKAKTRHYLLSILCAMGASREVITLCFGLNPESIHKFDEWVGTPLHYAISFGITASFSREMWTDSIFETVEYLIEKEPRLLTSQHNDRSESVLHQAILCLCPLAGPAGGARGPNDAHQLATLADVVVSLLLENQPLLATMMDTKDRLPLHIAAMHAVPLEIIERILKENKEACSCVCSTTGFTPLHYAAEAFGKSVWKFFHDMKRRSSDSDTLDMDLLSVRLDGHSKNIQHLVTTSPAAAQVEDLNGNLPLHLLMQTCFRDATAIPSDELFKSPNVFVIAFTTIYDAYPEASNIKDSNGETPIEIVKEQKENGDPVMDSIMRSFQEHNE
ncbi:expressed unknown protein [Seminavis robusta]|uniref:Uncharacterized protein n=1 Tax=Seminavis robusta TaxID=568900 RepID=A0A9N8EME4_9STRA|nr:expressed unknown protein [Seminavis robusta]|eukprot:Sro1256_g256630.1 n/a (1279) ;mRNA; f:14252-18088